MIERTIGAEIKSADEYHGKSGPLVDLPLEVVDLVKSVREEQQSLSEEDYPPVELFERLETSLTFSEIRTTFAYTKGPDGRWHIPFTPQLLAVRLQKGPEFINRQKIYGRLTNDWKDLVTVDSPDTEDAKQAMINNKLQAIEARKIATTPEQLSESDQIEERLQIIEKLGADVGMAAHSERVAALVSTFYALYIMNSHDKTLKNLSGQNLQQLAKKITKEDVESYKFSKDEVYLILSAAHDALWHDVGKKIKINGKFALADILTSAQKRTDEQIERMNKHTSYGAQYHLLSGLPIETVIVALMHHSKNLKKRK